jgi:hypothetical protein
VVEVALAADRWASVPTISTAIPRKQALRRDREFPRPPSATPRTISELRRCAGALIANRLNLLAEDDGWLSLNPRLLHLFLQGGISQKAAGALLCGELDRDDDVVGIVERLIEPMSRRPMPDSDEPSLLLKDGLPAGEVTNSMLDKDDQELPPSVVGKCRGMHRFNR